MTMDKDEARKLVIGLLRKEHPVDGKEFCSIAKDLRQFQEARTVLGYVPFPSEADPSFIMDLALSEGKAVAIPVCLEERLMGWAAWKPGIELVKTENKTMAPIKPCFIDIELPCLAIVPCIGLDREGYRLGRGGGFYDVFLKSNPGVFSIAMIKSFQLVDFDRSSLDQKLSGFFVEGQDLQEGL